MIKYRVWDKNEYKFIYPVIDVTNDFQLKYPSDRFVFDRFLLNDRHGNECYEHDIVYVEYRNNNNKIKDILAVLVNGGHHFDKFDWYLLGVDRIKYDVLWPLPELNNYRKTHGFNSITVKVGNVHENFNILDEEYNKYLTIKNSKKQ